MQQLIGVKRWMQAIFYGMMLVGVCSGTYAWSEESDSFDHISEALIKIYTTASQADYYRPWRKTYLSSGVGSGCIIAGNRILTNAHMVSDQTFIQVQRNGQDKKYPASVLYVSHEADLAILTVQDSSFFEGITPLSLGTLPEARDDVLVYGFPVGGDMLSVTKGIISRIEHQQYVHSSLDLLRVQLDAAINPGNSGGPVIKDTEIVGVVMQGVPGLQNTGYMVPAPVIEHFFTDIEDGRYDSFPDLGIRVQSLEPRALRQKLGLPDALSGLLVTYIVPGSAAEGLLQVHDVILKIDDHTVFDDGTIEFRPRERINVQYMITRHQIGETVKLEIFRDGTVLELFPMLTTTYQDLALVPLQQYDQTPRYLILGGIVFSPLTKNLILQWGQEYWRDAPKSYLVALGSERTPNRREVVVAIQVLPAEVNMGYHDLNNWIVETVDGKPFKDFDEFCALVRSSEAEYITFADQLGFEVVLDQDLAQATHERILRVHDINSGMSPDLLP